MHWKLKTLYAHKVIQRLSEFFTHNPADNDRVDWVIRKQLPVESLMGMIVSQPIDKLQIQCSAIHMYRFALI